MAGGHLKNYSLWRKEEPEQSRRFDENYRSRAKIEVLKNLEILFSVLAASPSLTFRHAFDVNRKMIQSLILQRQA
jgi:hypothetical protein